MCCAVLSRFSRLWFFATRCAVAHRVSLSMGFSRQEYCSGLPCPPAGDLPRPGIELEPPGAPALQAGSLPPSHQEAEAEIIRSQIPDQRNCEIITILLLAEATELRGNLSHSNR